MSDSIRRLSAQEVQPYASAGNAFSHLEHARAVAHSRPGSELIVREGQHYALYAPQEQLDLKNLSQQKGSQVLEFVGDQDLNLHNSEGLRGVGERLSTSDLRGRASAGNAFSRYTHAESVARHLDQDTAIVYQQGQYQLYALSEDSAERLLAGKNDLLDGKVVAVVHGGQPLFNWGAERSTSRSFPGFASVQHGQLQLDGQPYEIRGLNVYDLAAVGQRSESELRQTLRLIADSGVNTVRFWAFSKNDPEAIRHVLDTSRQMGLDLKFIPVLGNHWEHVEAEHSHFRKDDAWYRQGFEQHYWPHAKATVAALMDCPEVLCWELMNEPEGDTDDLRGFADEVSTRIRQLYDEAEAHSGEPIPHHLISLGTLAVGNNGWERPGMKGHDYKDLYGLPNLDLVTAHDYTTDTLEGSFRDFMHYAQELNKPFYLGEIGVKLGREGQAAAPAALERLQEKLQAFKEAGSSGALLWGPEPRGHAVDGDGYGFAYDQGDAALGDLQRVWDDP